MADDYRGVSWLPSPLLTAGLAGDRSLAGDVVGGGGCVCWGRVGKRVVVWGTEGGRLQTDDLKCDCGAATAVAAAKTANCRQT